MKTVAIIAEYNPFHNGHLYQIEKIREELGEDTAIIAIMSGNYTQRGDLAFMDKWARAKSAVLAGVNLVLELPFPYSISSAEFFAKAGVHIADSIGVVDVLSFGAESNDIDELSSAAKRMSTEEYKATLDKLIADYENTNVGYPEIAEAAYQKLYCTNPPKSTSNNILALEYIKAIIEKGSTIIPHTIKRHGADYNETSTVETGHQSATAIRSLISKNIDSANEYIPYTTFETILSERQNGAFPINESSLDAAVITKLRLDSSDAECDIHDAKGGLYNRIKSASLSAQDIPTLQALSVTKKYTNARIKRAIWYSYFGVTSSDIKNPPMYTQLLAMDKIGQALLKKIKKTTGFPILTKPSTPLEGEAQAQKNRSDKADLVYQMTKPVDKDGKNIYRKSPFVKG